MPNHEQHRKGAHRVGILLSIVIGIAIWIETESFLYISVGILIGYITTRIGGHLPDLDIKTSIIRRYTESIIQASIVIGTLGFYIIYINPINQKTQQLINSIDIGIPPIIATVISILVILALVVRYIPIVIQNIMPKHRGILHSFPFWILIIGTISISLYIGLSSIGFPKPSLDIIVASGFIGTVTGVATHLGMDKELLPI